MLAQWGLLVADFASEYSIRLTVEVHAMPWAEFVPLAIGLMASDTRIRRHFTTPPPEPSSTFVGSAHAQHADD